MYSVVRNPISYSFYAFSVIFVVISFGESMSLVAQHIFLPYTIDVSRGIGDMADRLFCVWAIILQILVFLSVYVVTRLPPNNKRFLCSVIGVFFVVVYFLILTIGYVTPRLH